MKYLIKATFKGGPLNKVYEAPNKMMARIQANADNYVPGMGSKDNYKIHFVIEVPNDTATTNDQLPTQARQQNQNAAGQVFVQADSGGTGNAAGRPTKAKRKPSRFW